jgi:hypothetical protein
MRPTANAIVMLGCILGCVLGTSAHAQTYDPRYPVCIEVFGGRFGGNYIDCSYTSLPQCRATASGRAATCSINPYYAGPVRAKPRRYRHQAY